VCTCWVCHNCGVCLHLHLQTVGMHAHPLSSVVQACAHLQSSFLMLCQPVALDGVVGCSFWFSWMVVCLLVII
jgi:hypothetical protein